MTVDDFRHEMKQIAAIENMLRYEFKDHKLFNSFVNRINTLIEIGYQQMERNNETQQNEVNIQAANSNVSG
jgi:hypothetical protein